MPKHLRPQGHESFVVGHRRAHLGRKHKARVAAKNWQEFGPANVSYEFLNPGGSETNPYVLLTRCPVHGNVGLSDGSVWQGVGLGRSFTIAVKDGKQIFTPLNPPANASPFE